MVACAAGRVEAQSPLGTAFSYQGQLKDAGMPVNGTADFQFRLHDALSAGNLVAGPVSVNNVVVTEGLFTVSIDFGSAAFNGQARWLEIAARSPAGSGTFTTLTPRQPLLAVPYARYSATSPWTGLSGVPAGFADGIDNGSGDGHSLDAADGSPVNALYVDNSGDVGIGTTAPGFRLDVRAGFDGDGVHVQGPGMPGIGYLLTGDGGSGFLGLASANGSFNLSAVSGDVILGSNAGRLLLATGVLNPAAMIINGANVGIGTGFPAAKLDVRGDVKLGSSGQYFAPGGEENLRIVRGTVDGDGSILAGSGFTVSHSETGNYDILFNIPFASRPSVVANALQPLSGNDRIVSGWELNGALTDRVNIFARDLAGDPVNADFSFIAIGPR